jgi:hypothetical protein
MKKALGGEPKALAIINLFLKSNYNTIFIAL